MVSVFAIAAVAASSTAAPVAPAGDPAQLDRRCYALMAQLAEADDPPTRALGMAAAHYFLGRLDARGLAPAAEAPASAPALVRACGDAMEAAGHDFRRLGQALERGRSAI